MANNSLNCGPLTIKYLVFIFNLIFFLSGVAIVVVGVTCQYFFKENMAIFQDDYKNPATGVIILGVAVMIFSFFGCCGSKMESVWMLRIFACFLGFLLLCEIAGGIAIAVMRSDIGTIIIKHMNRTMPEYGDENNKVITDTWDHLQINLKCCGTSNYSDWQATNWSKINGDSVPDSCCVNKTKLCGHAVFNETSLPPLFPDGCASSLKQAFISNLGSIVSATVVVAVIQVIGMWMSCSLITAVKERYEIL